MDLRRRTIARVSVYSTPALRVGVYRCPPGDDLWHETNDNIGERPHVVFPGTAVGLVRDGVRLVVTPNDVVFYRPFETYERTLRDERGDVSLFIAPQHLDIPDAPLGKADGRSFLLARRLASRLHERDALFVEETALELVARAIRGPAPTSGHRPATRRDRIELVEAAKDVLLARLGEPLSLGSLAGELHVSPFHLTRVFRELTGRTLTAYLHDLRLRAAVERLGEDSLSRIAADLGYCSPSHFTDRFRAAFGVPPSQLRNFMEAAARTSS
jgi:AraC-like DNA-binding protein